MTVVSIPARPTAKDASSTGIVEPVAVSALLAAILLVLLLIAGVMLDTAYEHRALPGLTMGGTPVGSLDEIALRARLRDEAQVWPNGAVEVPFDGRAWHASDASLHTTPDIDRAVRVAVGYGKSGPLAVRLGSWVAALAGQAHLPLPLRPEGAALATWVDEVARGIERPVVNGELRVVASGVVAVAPETGRYVDRVALMDAVLAPARPGDRRVSVPTRVVLPATDPAEFARVARQAEALLAPLTMRAGAGPVTLEREHLARLVTVRRIADPRADARAASSGTFAPSRATFALSADDAQLTAAIATLGSALDRAPRDAGYLAQRNGSIAVVPAIDGVAVDRTALHAAVHRALTDPDAPRDLQIATAPLSAPFTTAQAERAAPLLTRIAFHEAYGPTDTAQPPLDRVVPPGGVFGAGAAPTLAPALAAAAIAAGYEVDVDDLWWRNDTLSPVIARAVPTQTSVIAELWGVPSGRQVAWGPPDASGRLLRTVTAAGAVLRQDRVPARLAPPQAPIPLAAPPASPPGQPAVPVETAPITASGARR